MLQKRRSIDFVALALLSCDQVCCNYRHSTVTNWNQVAWPELVLSRVRELFQKYRDQVLDLDEVTNLPLSHHCCRWKWDISITRRASYTEDKHKCPEGVFWLAKIGPEISQQLMLHHDNSTLLLCQLIQPMVNNSLGSWKTWPYIKPFFSLKIRR